MKVVYIAGPYSGPSEYDVKLNIFRAERLAFEVWKTRLAAAICPHMNTAHWGGVLRWDDFLAGDEAILAKCDAVLMVPGYEFSRGAVREKLFSEAHNIPVFHTVTALLEWLGRKEAAA